MLDLDIKHQSSNSRFRLLSRDDRWGHKGITLVKFLAHSFVAFSLVGVVGATLRCGLRASRRGGFSRCRAQALGRTEFSSCGSRVLEQSLAVGAHGLCCSTAGGSFPELDQTHVSCIGRWILHQLSHQGSPTMLLHDPQKHWISKSFF